MPQTNERAFETYVETILKDRSGWKSGDLADWDEARALFKEQVFEFLQETQPKLWAEMEKLHGAGRVNSALNVAVFIGMFSGQWAVGLVLNLWPSTAAGYAPDAYAWALGGLWLV